VPRPTLILFLFMSGCGSPAATLPEPEPPPPEVTTFVPASTTLKVGDTLPPLIAKGWVNGPPPVLGAAGQKLLVVDVWAHWCPFCKATAPNLVQLHAKYSPMGVAFVGVTNMPDDMVEDYVQKSKIPWANGYLIDGDMITRLGAGSGMSVAGYQIAPTIYIVGPDGVIRWTDGRHRQRHPKTTDWEKELDAGIAAALAMPSR
jgi:thiol-disulfide isomerase/thioredoxin